jgi:hypothetical protein
MPKRRLIGPAPGGNHAWIPGASWYGGFFVLIGLLWIGNSPSRGADADVPKEYQIKAAFLYNFTKFVEWPAQHFTTDSHPIVIGVLGRNPFGEELEKIIKGRRGNGREIAIAFVETSADAVSADLVFVCVGEESRFEAMNAALCQAQVLTVGESPRFAQAGGIITFLREADKVRFAINLESAGRAGLKVSAQLLKLATEVQRKSKPP